MTPKTIDARIARCAAAQLGVFSRRQATELGATKRMVQHRLATGRWGRVTGDVLRLEGSPVSWRQSLTAAVLAWGPGAAASHHAAAVLWRLHGFEQGPVELTVPRDRRRGADGIVHRGRLFANDVRRLDGLPVTTPARTLFDLAAVTSFDALEEALDDALRRSLVNASSLRRRLVDTAKQGRPGIKTMRALLDARDASAAVPGSVFERRLLRTMRGDGLPEPTAQYPIRRDGRLVAVVDFAFPTMRLAVEADGHEWHSGRRRWERDRARRNELTLLGWRVIHVTWTDLVRRPSLVTGAVRAAIDGEPQN